MSLATSALPKNRSGISATLLALIATRTPLAGRISGYVRRSEATGSRRGRQLSPRGACSSTASPGITDGGLGACPSVLRRGEPTSNEWWILIGSPAGEVGSRLLAGSGPEQSARASTVPSSSGTCGHRSLLRADRHLRRRRALRLRATEELRQVEQTLGFRSNDACSAYTSPPAKIHHSATSRSPTVFAPSPFTSIRNNGDVSGPPPPL